MADEDVPEKARAAASDANHEEVMAELDNALRHLAAAQRRAGIRFVITRMATGEGLMEAKMVPIGGPPFVYALVDRAGVVNRANHLPWPSKSK
jgi:hypothetical protein